MCKKNTSNAALSLPQASNRFDLPLNKESFEYADEFINAQEGKTERWSLEGFGALARGLESLDGMLRFLQDMRSAIDVVALRKFCDAFALRMYAWDNYRSTGVRTQRQPSEL